MYICSKFTLMKILITPFLILFSITININAQKPGSIKAGINYSTFYDEKNNGWMPGFSISLNKYWQLTDRFSIGSEFNYCQKGGIIRNKFKAPYYSDKQERLRYFDIHARIGFLQIPLLIKYKFYNKWKIEFNVFAGYFIAIPVTDLSELKFNGDYKQYDPDNLDDRNYNFEYYDNEEWSGPFSGSYKLNKGIELGVSATYSIYYLEIKYTRDLQVFGEIESVSSINKRTHIFNILFGMNFEYNNK